LVVTGDLTVDTSTLKVDSATNRVGIGTPSPNYQASLGNNFANLKLALFDGATASGFGVQDAEVIALIDLSTSKWTWKSSSPSATVMTLLATGQLGIGVTPTEALQILGNLRLSGSIGFGQAPTAALDLGTTLANTKIALYGGGTAAGFGVQSGDVRFHLDFSTSKFSWRPTPAGASIMELSGAGALTLSGVAVPTISSTSTLTNKTLTTPTINGCTTSGTWSGNSTFSGANTYSGLSTRTSGVKVATRSTSTTPVTMATTDEVILADATSAAVTVNLQAAATAGAGRRLTVVKTDSSGNAVTLDGSGSETINGSTTLALAAQYDRMTIVCDGSNWIRID